MTLPPLSHDFRHARIESVDMGPRRELALCIAPLVWDGPNGHYTKAVRVRFGGIKNFAEVSAFFADAPQQISELECLRYSPGRHSKPGRLFFELPFERIDARLIIECSSLQISAPQ